MVVEILMLAGIMVLCVGVCSALTFLIKIHELLHSIEFSQSQTFKKVCGSQFPVRGPSVAEDVQKIANLLEATKDERIPDLRHDSLYSTEDEFERS